MKQNICLKQKYIELLVIFFWLLRTQTQVILKVMHVIRCVWNAKMKILIIY